MANGPALGSRVRLLALDADGTLVDPDGEIRPAVRDAIARARSRGLLVMICTGRRYRTTRPLLEQLDLDGPVVLHNGVLIKDARSGETTADLFLPPDLFAPAMEIMRGDAPPLVYVDQFFDGIDLYAEPRDRCHAFQAEYLESNPAVVKEVDSVSQPPSESVVMISSMADDVTLLKLKQRVETRLGAQVQTNFIMNKNYRGHILEVTRAGVNKWLALEQVATSLGIEKSQIAAIGDDTNDTEMIANAGIGIAMDNAVDEVKAVANWITESNDRDGVARAIERLLD